MRFNFYFNPAEMTSETIIAMLIAAVVFIAVPALLAIMEYRMTKKNRQAGLYLMLGVFVSAILFGLYSLLVGLLLLIIYQVASGEGKRKIDKRTMQPAE